MKVAIIGAGICGLYLGWKLSINGHQVTIFEKRDRIGKEVCSGLFSERILDFVPETRKLIQNKIEHCLIYFPRRTLKIKFSKPFFVISHYQLDNLTADLAEKAGAKILLNQNIMRTGLAELQKEFDRIIGCDGANSFVRKYLGLPDPNFWLATQGFTPEKNSADLVETWPQKRGFIWKIPRGSETEYGIIYPSEAKGGEERMFFDENPKRARALFEEFLTKKGIQLPERSEGWRRTNVLRLERTNSALVPQGLIIPKNPKITLCGDAAGLIKPWSGGGVIWGLFAANLLLKNFPDFIKYQKETRRFFLPKIILSKTAKKLVYFLGFNSPWLLPKNVKIEGDFLI